MIYPRTELVYFHEVSVFDRADLLPVHNEVEASKVKSVFNQRQLLGGKGKRIHTAPFGFGTGVFRYSTTLADELRDCKSIS